MKLGYIKKDTRAIAPKRATEGSACLDVYALETINVPANESLVVDTGLSLVIPSCWEVQIRPCLNDGITVLNSPATIDSFYRGNLKVVLYNTTQRTVNILYGQPIAQVQLVPVPSVKLIEMFSRPEKSTSRFEDFCPLKYFKK